MARPIGSRNPHHRLDRKVILRTVAGRGCGQFGPDNPSPTTKLTAMQVVTIRHLLAEGHVTVNPPHG